MRGAKREAYAFRQLLFGERDDVVEVTTEEIERQIERDARRDALGEGVRAVADNAGPVLPRPRERVGSRGLHADDFGVAADAASYDRAAARAAASADRHQDHVRIWELLEDFERVGSNSGEKKRLVRREHVAQPTLPR